MWDQVKQVLTDGARELCESVRVGKKNPMSKWWNDKFQAAVVRKKAV